MIFELKSWWDSHVIVSIEIIEIDAWHLRFKRALMEGLAAGADLTRADLTRADLTGADLTEANLTNAYLTGANLTDAYLNEADLTQVRDDVWAILSASPKEVFSFRQALVQGKVDGNLYEGECVCLVGWLEKTAGVSHGQHSLLKPNSARIAERFMTRIKRGDTPNTSHLSRRVLGWVDQWLANMREAFEH